MEKENIKLLFFVALVIISVCVPYLFRDLEGEEGIFAMISYYPLQLPKVGIIGREDMELKYIVLGHPVPAYLILRFIGFSIQQFYSFLKIDSNPIRDIILLRFLLSFFNLIFTISLICICFKKIIHPQNRLLFMCFSLGLFSSIFFCLASSHIQYESSGFLLVTLSLSFILLGTYWFKSSLRETILLILSGSIFGLGKNEWSIIVFLVILCFFILRRTHQANMQSIKFISGLILGNYVSWFLSPDNYLKGFILITEFTIAQKSFYSLIQRLFFLKIVIFWFCKEIILFIILIILGVRKYIKDKTSGNNWLFCFVLLFILLYVTALLIASWPGDGFPRYFLICIPFFLIFVALYMKEEISYHLEKRLLSLFVIIFILNLGQHSFTKSGFRSIFMKNKTFICSERLRKQGIDDSCIYIVPSGVGWYLPTLNFFHDDLRKKSMIHKKPICKFMCEDS